MCPLPLQFLSTLNNLAYIASATINLIETWRKDSEKKKKKDASQVNFLFKDT